MTTDYIDAPRGSLMMGKMRRYVGKLSGGKRVYVRSDDPSRLVFAVFASEKSHPDELRLVAKIPGREVREMTCQNGLDHAADTGCHWAWPGGGDRNTEGGRRISAGAHAAWTAHWWRCAGGAAATEVVELRPVKKRGAP